MSARAAAWVPSSGSMKLQIGSLRPVVVVIVERYTSKLSIEIIAK